MLDPTPNIRRLAEAELYRAELEARRAVGRLAWVGAAMLIAAIALVMLVMAAFLALSQLYGPTLAALITGAGLLVLAMAALLLARRPPSRADRLEMEIANRTITEARHEIRRDFEQFERRLDQLSMGVLGLIKGSSAHLPVLTVILGALAAFSPALRRIIMPFLKKDEAP
jgi:hypothetical protein